MAKVHLVGSVPLANAETVFRTVADVLGDRVDRIPDGETGNRRYWITFQYDVLANHPALEVAPAPATSFQDGYREDVEEGARSAARTTSTTAATPTATPRTAPPTPKYPRLRLRPGIAMDSPTQLADSLGELGYAASALASYQVFARLKREGVIRPSVRFQVSLPTPLAPIAMFIAPSDLFALAAVYELALLRELARILDAVPHAELAVQWDYAVEVAIWEGVFPRPPVPDWRSVLLGPVVRCINGVPADVDVGVHLCYGDAGHEHFAEPKDLAVLTEISQAILAAAARPLRWLHMPVPRSRDDDAYFQPLRGLALPADTQLFLGVVHYTDGVAGTQRRIEAARRTLGPDAPQFGIATECGMGRRRDDTILELLKVHAAAL